MIEVHAGVALLTLLTIALSVGGLGYILGGGCNKKWDTTILLDVKNEVRGSSVVSVTQWAPSTLQPGDEVVALMFRGARSGLMPAIKSIACLVSPESGTTCETYGIRHQLDFGPRGMYVELMQPIQVPPDAAQSLIIEIIDPDNSFGVLKYTATWIESSVDAIV